MVGSEQRAQLLEEYFAAVEDRGLRTNLQEFYTFLRIRRSQGYAFPFPIRGDAVRNLVDDFQKLDKYSSQRLWRLVCVRGILELKSAGHGIPPSFPNLESVLAYNALARNLKQRVLDHGVGNREVFRDSQALVSQTVRQFGSHHPLGRLYMIGGRV